MTKSKVTAEQLAELEGILTKIREMELERYRKIDLELGKTKSAFIKGTKSAYVKLTQSGCRKEKRALK